MGGSSLAPEVFASVLGVAAGHPALTGPRLDPSRSGPGGCRLHRSCSDDLHRFLQVGRDPRDDLRIPVLLASNRRRRQPLHCNHRPRQFPRATGKGPGISSCRQRTRGRRRPLLGADAFRPSSGRDDRGRSRGSARGGGRISWEESVDLGIVMGGVGRRGPRQARPSSLLPG